MATIASVNVALTADSSRLNRGLSQAEARTQRYSRRAQRSYRRVAAAARAASIAFIAVAAALGARQLLQGIDNQVKLAQATGLTFEQFQRLGFAFSQAGVSQEQFQRGLLRLSRSVDELMTGSGAAAEALQRLGISFGDIGGLDQQRQLELVLDRLRGIDDAGTRAALASEIFGQRLAGALGPVLSQTTEQINELGDSIQVISTRDAQRVERLNDSFSRLSQAFTVLFATFSPVFEALSAQLERTARVINQYVVPAIRISINFIIRQLNNLLDGLDRVNRYFGGDGIQFRFMEWTDAVEETAEAIPDLQFELDELGRTVDGTAPALNSFEQTMVDLMDTTDEYANLATRTFDRLADTITDFVTTGTASIRDFVRETLRSFIQLQVRTALFGGANLFGLANIPGRQFGGPVNAGQPYIVGERGPELFVPNNGGNIVRNDQLGGAASGSVTYNIQAVDARSFQQLVASDPSFIYNVTERGRRANVR